MNLISCNNCGVVLDKDNLNFPSDIYREDGSVILELAAWDGYKEKFVPKLPCPVCKEEITA